MDKDWAEKNKEIQGLLNKEATFPEAIEKLLAFREEMFTQVTQIVNGFPKEAFYQMPFAGANGYHSKTLGYSIWHIFRIEDIVAHELIAGDNQVLFRDGYLKKVKATIQTTGNELEGEDLVIFSKALDRDGLYQYAKAVKESTDEILRNLTYSDLKGTFRNEDKEKLHRTGCVSEDENAVWLIDYWCNKNVKGLLKMPFSRHWIMHIEAMRRIKNKLCQMARKDVDPIAYCGFSCNHCFLGAWCGSCRTSYNTCSFATCSPNKVCENVACCQEKELDGCYECKELETCTKGFYVDGNDGASAAKAQAMFIKKYGKKDFIRVHDKMHESHDFAKTQEILGQDMWEGLSILEGFR